MRRNGVYGVQVQLFDLEAMKVLGHFPLAPDGSTITALAFNAGGTVLAAATAAGGLVTYQVAGRRVAPWHSNNSETLAERMASLPESARQLSFSPDPKVTLPRVTPSKPINLPRSNV